MLDKLAQLCPGVLVEGDSKRPHLPFDAQCFVSSTLSRVLDGGASVTVKAAALALLPHLTRGYAASSPVPYLRAGTPVVLSELHTRVLALLSSGVVGRFPLRSTDLAPGSVEHTEHRLVFQTLLLQLARTCSLDVLRCLLHVLREGPAHLFAGEIAAALATASAAVAAEGDTMRAFLGDVLGLLGDCGVALEVRWCRVG